MDYKELVFRFALLFRRHWLPLSLGILGMTFFVYGLIGLFGANKSSENIVFEASAGQNSAVEIKTILVDIEGAVQKPGVYKLPLESRIQDGLVAAGGLSAKADRDYVAKNFNQAIKLTDGAKIYVPSLEEAVDNASVLSASSGSVNVGGLININSASESELDSLPGVGPVTAQKIIAGRQYGSVDELLSKKIVGTKVFEQIKDKITVY